MEPREYFKIQRRKFEKLLYNGAVITPVLFCGIIGLASLQNDYGTKEMHYTKKYNIEDGNNQSRKSQITQSELEEKIIMEK